MGIKVRNVASDSDLRNFSVDFSIISGSDSSINVFTVPFKCQLREYGFGMTAAGKSSVWTIANQTKSATLVNAGVLSAPAAKGSVVSTKLLSDSDISAGSLIQITVSSTALAKGYGFAKFKILQD